MSLKQIMREHVTSVFLNTGHHADSIELDTEETVVALVLLERPLVSEVGDAPASLTGRVSVASDDESKMLEADSFTFEGDTFNIIGNGTPRIGMVSFEVIRATANNTNHNIFDQHDNQATWVE